MALGIGSSATARSLSFAVLAAVALLGGCASNFPLMPTPAVYVGEQAKPLFTDIPADRQKPPIDLLYVTDRAPKAKPEEKLPYSAERSRSMAFGSVTVEVRQGRHVGHVWLRQSTVSKRSVSLDLTLGPTVELGRFPPIVYDMVATPAGMTRAPAVVDAHEKAAAGLQAEVKRRLAAVPRKEVVLYVHGYANTFDDAAFTMGELCHFLGREFVCGIFTWPAGGKRGLFMGYNVDRESGEFAAHHLKQAIRIIADTPGVERLHLLAHSRGTDVLATALGDLGIEAYADGGILMDRRLKLANVVLLAPDMDADVAVAKMFRIVSDPDMPYGQAPNPRGAFQPPQMRVTVYTSPNDKALSLSQWLFGSLGRLGRVDAATLSAEDLAKSRQFAGFVSYIQFSGKTDFIGHSYFTSDPTVSSDLVAVIRYGLPPGDPGRPLEEVSRPYWRVSEAPAQPK